jgi:hypothetical protein
MLLTRHARQHADGARERWRTEKDLGDENGEVSEGDFPQRAEPKGESHRFGGISLMKEDPPGVIDTQINPMEETEDHELQPGPVPDSDRNHGDKGWNGGHREITRECFQSLPADGEMSFGAAPGNPEGDRVVEVEVEITGEGHVPPLPEIDDRAAFVGGIKISRKTDVEEQPQPDRHFRVAGKIEIELHGVGESAEPCLQESQSSRIAEADVRIGGKIVGNDIFLGQPDKEDREADRDVVELEAPNLFVLELGQHLPVVEDRPGDQMREEGNEKSIVDKTAARSEGRLAIDEIANLGKGKERDAEGEKDGGTGWNELDSVLLDPVENWKKVFVVAEEKEIRGHPESEDGLLEGGLFDRSLDHATHGVVEDDRAAKE